ncbi:hypothetical protein NCS57_01099400 [Fusarium keratoplasticum]|uniref:Uncharacterized protein n=1 Tax=Fusarium keratoplasticum TaxID=1328300 RepID=A0ACC0QKG2_9HYPO|nr:hypothetical protein NCS57_01099400 [Fusarium keratoplasticum]KAI8657216.1 hypothetical protein NCS57_01099400 [Fusarium keratoplasticum]KAI8658192.1 hypothetical protein NCS55_01094300 [Fusarium keratoplasticum]
MGFINRKTAALGLLAVGSHAAPQAATPTADAQAAPATYTANPNVGPGGSSFKDSAHFRVYGGNANDVSQAIDMLEGAYDCLVGTLKWRSPGLSFNDVEGTGEHYKTNIYSVGTLENAAGVMHSDYETGLAWLEVVNEYLAVPGVTVHEYGHGLHYHQRTWVDQGRTGAWWETLANWVADTYKTSDICADARSKHNQETSATEIELNKVLGDSHQVIVDGSVNTGNYYQAWPFFTYLTNNPDDFAGLGQDTLRQLMVQYQEGSNETPLHTLARVSQNATIGDIVGRYWARMAYVDIGHPSAQEVFFNQRETINFANVEASGNGYKPKADRQPRYMGANIIPLTVSGSEVQVKVTSDAEFVATVVVYREGGESSYVTLTNGAATVPVKTGEQVSVVVANAPAEPILYDGFNLSDEVSKGLDYTLEVTGATVQV